MKKPDATKPGPSKDTKTPIGKASFQFFFGPKIDDNVMQKYRQQVAEAQEYEKMKKDKKRIRREKLKNREKLEKERQDILSGKKHGSDNTEKSTMLYQQKQESGSLYTIDEKSSIKSERASQTPSIAVGSSISAIGPKQSVTKPNAKKNEHRNLFLDHSSGPSHFSAQDKEQDALKKYKEKKKRRISQLYTGEVYHHELTYIWDHLKDRTRFYDKLDELTRQKFPITPEIQKKLDQIKKKKELREVAKQKEKNGTEHLGWKILHRARRAFLSVFQRTNIGYVCKTTPRYYKMTPVVPIRCRRCRNLLKDSLETRWTPIGISFAILFPIFGFLCCLSYREFVCVICEEIYTYGDYPSRCRPLDKSKLMTEANVRFKRRSFNRQWKM